MNQGCIGWSVQMPTVAPYLNIQDVRTDGTGGGAFSSGSWATRTLNTIISDSGNLMGGSPISSQFTLPAGHYRASISANAFGVADHQARLRNITLGTTVLAGQNSRSPGSSDHDKSYISGEFWLHQPTALEIQSRCETTNGTDGFGRATNFVSEGEVYTIAEFWKIP